MGRKSKPQTSSLIVCWKCVIIDINWFILIHGLVGLDKVEEKSGKKIGFGEEIHHNAYQTDGNRWIQVVRDEDNY